MSEALLPQRHKADSPLLDLPVSPLHSNRAIRMTEDVRIHCLTSRKVIRARMRVSLVALHLSDASLGD